MPENCIDVSRHRDGFWLQIDQDLGPGDENANWCKLTPEYARGLRDRLDVLLSEIESKEQSK